MWKWERGRQDTGYDKLLLFRSMRLKMDVHILRYPTGSYVTPHKDPPDEGYQHHRLNVVLQKAKRGGRFWKEVSARVEPDTMYRFGRFIRFRPDLYTHGVTPILEGTRYVLSIGWLRKEK